MWANHCMIMHKQVLKYDSSLKFSSKVRECPDRTAEIWEITLYHTHNLVTCGM